MTFKSPIPQAYSLTHAPIDFHFSQNARDFVVREIPLYPFSQSGEHLILQIRKKGLSTQEMLKLLSSHTGCRNFGYAGLKDKSATTIQFISMHKSFESSLNQAIPSLDQRGIQILSQTYHNNKIKLGHLRGNHFFIRLKKVTPANATRLEAALQNLKIQGMPNYFGYQRFGKFQDNHIQALRLIKGELEVRQKSLQNFLISSLQSYIFNLWLEQRIHLSHLVAGFKGSELKQALGSSDFFQHLDAKQLQAQKQFFKILKGEVMEHYPKGRLFCAQDIPQDAARFLQHAISPTGALFGKKLFGAQDEALILEQNLLQSLHLDGLGGIPAIGSRRYAWVWADEIHSRYTQQEAHFELEFSLPKGSYATIFIQELAHQNIRLD